MALKWIPTPRRAPKKLNVGARAKAIINHDRAERHLEAVANAHAVNCAPWQALFEAKKDHASAQFDLRQHGCTGL